MDSIIPFNQDGNSSGNSPFPYPASLLFELQERIGLDSTDVIAGIGSGVSILAPLLLTNGNSVYAVELYAQQRHDLQCRFPKYPRLVCVERLLQDPSLLEQSVDHIMVVQSFPTYNLGKIKAAFRRILRLGGFVVFVWNVPDQSNLFMKRLEQLLEEYGVGIHLLSGGLEARNQEVVDFFFPNSFHSFSIPNHHELQYEDTMAYLKSIVIDFQEDTLRYNSLEEAVIKLYTETCSNYLGQFTYNTEVIYGEV